MSTSEAWDHHPPSTFTPHGSAPGKAIRKVVIVYADNTEKTLERRDVGTIWHKSFLNDDEIAARAARQPARYWRDHEITWREPRERPTDG